MPITKSCVHLNLDVFEAKVFLIQKIMSNNKVEPKNNIEEAKEILLMMIEKGIIDEKDGFKQQVQTSKGTYNFSIDFSLMEVNYIED